MIKSARTKPKHISPFDFDVKSTHIRKNHLQHLKLFRESLTPKKSQKLFSKGVYETERKYGTK
jgi:hypothetical protein